MNRIRLITTACAAAAIAASAFAGSAFGATATYTATDTPKGIAHNDTETSTLTVPGGRPPAIDVDLVQFNLSANPGGTDFSFLLRNPAGVERFLVLAACPGFTGTTFNLDQQAGTEPLGHASTCPPVSNATYRPSNSPASSTPLTDLNGPASGAWTATLDDAGVTDPNGILDDAIVGAWGLRITHAPLELTPAIKKQKLRPKLKFRATCNGNCELTVAGNVKTKVVQLTSGVQTLIKVKLKDGALDRLEDSGNAKIKLKVTNDLAETVQVKSKIKIKR